MCLDGRLTEMQGAASLMRGAKIGSKVFYICLSNLKYYWIERRQPPGAAQAMLEIFEYLRIWDAYQLAWMLFVHYKTKTAMSRIVPRTLARILCPPNNVFCFCLSIFIHVLSFISSMSIRHWLSPPQFYFCAFFTLSRALSHFNGGFGSPKFGRKFYGEHCWRSLDCINSFICLLMEWSSSWLICNVYPNLLDD